MNIAVILAGGSGTRMGTDIPKQYIMVDGKPIVLYCIETFANRQDIDAFVIVAAKEWQDFISQYTNRIRQPVWYALSGATRQHSIYNGLKECRKHNVNDDSIVIVHDAARPLVSNEIIDACIEGCVCYDGVLPVIPVKDTIYMSQDGEMIGGLLERNCLYAGQAPESFVFGKYIGIHDKCSYDEIGRINGSTEIAYKKGLNVKLVKGETMNFKITTPEDLTSFETIIKNRQR